MIRRYNIVVIIGISLVALADSALAYGGPGSGLSALGSLFAIVGAVFFALVGFIWYPIKRLLKRLGRNSGTSSTK